MIDFHCHLDLYPDPAAAAANAQASNVAVLSVTTTPTAFVGTRALAAGNPLIRTALGLHPELAHQRSHELNQFDRLLPEAEFVGEIGLDGSQRFRQTRTQQLEVFDHILRSCADAGGRIMSIHSRGSVPTVLRSLNAVPEAGTPVLHWFTGTVGQAESAVESGCWFSVGTQMLTSPKGRALVQALPRDRILTETDGPFTAVGARAAEPADVSATLNLLATLWEVTVSDSRDQITSNLQSILEGFGGASPSVRVI